MRAVVRKQAILLGIGMAAGILSMALGSLAEGIVHQSGQWISMTAFGTFMLVLFNVRPDFLR